MKGRKSEQVVGLISRGKKKCGLKMWDRRILSNKKFSYATFHCPSYSSPADSVCPCVDWSVDWSFRVPDRCILTPKKKSRFHEPWG
jgi:hypothetical protein